MSSENKNRLELLEEHFKAGRFEPAELLLSILSNQKLPILSAIRVAEIARRSGQSQMALETLRKSLGKKKLLSAPPELIAEFAANLGVLGDWKTSEKLFHSAELTHHADYALPRAIALMNGWEFEAAIPLLRITIAQSQQASARVSAQLRLATCLLRSGDRTQAEESHRIIQDFLSQFGKQAEFLPQKVYALHLQTEWLYFARKDAKSALSNIDDLIREFPKHDQTIPRTWQLLLSMRTQGMKPELTEAFQALRVQTLQGKQPHLLRMIDFLSACVLNEPVAIARVWFGSPFEGLRKLLKQRLPVQLIPNAPFQSFRVDPRTGLSITSPSGMQHSSADHQGTLDLMRGSFKATQENPFLKLGQITHQLLILLTSDFYRPIPTIEIFAGLYSDDIYEPGPAETRIHAQVSRARKQLLAETRGFTIEPDESGSGYLLRSVPITSRGKEVQWDLSICVPNPEAPAKPSNTTPGIPNKGVRTVSRLEFELDVLVTELKKARTQAPKATSEPLTFGSEEAAEIWDISARSANNRIKEALEAGKLIKLGSGPKTRYQFKGEK